MAVDRFAPYPTSGRLASGQSTVPRAARSQANSTSAAATSTINPADLAVLNHEQQGAPPTFLRSSFPPHPHHHPTHTFPYFFAAVDTAQMEIEGMNPAPNNLFAPSDSKDEPEENQAEDSENQAEPSDSDDDPADPAPALGAPSTVRAPVALIRAFNSAATQAGLNAKHRALGITSCDVFHPPIPCFVPYKRSEPRCMPLFLSHYTAMP